MDSLIAPMASSPAIKRFRSHLFSFFLIICAVAASSSPRRMVSYSDHCASVVPEASPSATTPATGLPYLTTSPGYFTGGDRIFSDSQFRRVLYAGERSVAFNPTSVRATNVTGTYEMEATLSLRNWSFYYVPLNSSRRGSDYRPRREGLGFRLKGFWSSRSDMLCMVGSCSWLWRRRREVELDAVLKLNFPSNITVYSGFVNGILESLVSSGDDRYFEPISITAFALAALDTYKYALVDYKFEKGCSGRTEVPLIRSLSLRPIELCSMILSQYENYELVYPGNCSSSRNCTPFGKGTGLPAFLSLYPIECSENDAKLRILVRFSNSSYPRHYQYFEPNETLIGEASWDGKRNRLCVVACQILNRHRPLESVRVDDCSTKLSLRFPAVLSIRNTGRIEGEIWSDKPKNHSRYFETIKFQGPDKQRWTHTQGLKYEYTEIDRAKRSCLGTSGQTIPGRYPKGYPYEMRFDVLVRISGNISGWGSAVPISVGNQLLGQSRSVSSRWGNRTGLLGGPLNISYEISFTLRAGLKSVGPIPSGSLTEITAEGVYDAKTGHLCMVGCRRLSSKFQNPANGSMDCEILVTIQFPPKNSKTGQYVTGRITSTRTTNDSLYFESLNITSAAFTVAEAARTIWRVDLEVVMLLISNTASCVFAGLQLLHARRKPDVLPRISLIMLLILVSGQMIPLLLNFEAVFKWNRDGQDLDIGRVWLELNEVLIRVITMAAFLLELRLLQLSWNAKHGKEGIRRAEVKTLLLSIPIYILGGSIAILSSRKKPNYSSTRLRSAVAWQERNPRLRALRSYAGLVLDGFLFPQILINVFVGSGGSTLSSPFFVGTTLVRSLPHAYGLYRGRSSSRCHFDRLCVYANPGADYFSVGWDIVMPCVGTLFAAVVFLQQKFGGRCVLPPRFREFDGYEKVVMWRKTAGPIEN